MSKRVLIKLSGEAISGDRGVFDPSVASLVCENIKKLMSLGIGVSLVIGGGNIVRGRDFKKTLPPSIIDCKVIDSAGMLATVINGLFLKGILLSLGIDSVIVSPLDLPFDIKKLSTEEIDSNLNLGKVVIFVGGSGLPCFSTDTISVIAAIMSSSDVVLKATKTDGVYDKDPKIFPDAEFIQSITHQKAIDKNLQIFDQTALVLARDHSMPIIVFSMNESNCFVRVLNKKIKYSEIS